MSYMNVKLVGTHFRPQQAKDIVALMQVGAVITFEREPTNEFDPNAIKCMHLGHHIGYIEAQQAIWIAPEMDQALDPDAPTDSEGNPDMTVHGWTGDVVDFHETTRVRYPVMTVKESAEAADE